MFWGGIQDCFEVDGHFQFRWLNTVISFWGYVKLRVSTDKPLKIKRRTLSPAS